MHMAAALTPNRRLGRARWAVMAVLLLTLLWRGLVPAGFMPSMAALQSLRWQLDVCSVGGHPLTLTLPAGDLPDVQHDTAPGCAFALAALHLLDVPPVHAMPMLAVAMVPIAWTVLTSPWRAAQVFGPPLGSRAPPR